MSLRGSSEGSPSGSSTGTEVEVGKSFSRNTDLFDDDARTEELESEIQKLRSQVFESDTKAVHLKAEVDQLRIRTDQQKNENSKLELEIRRLTRLEAHRKETSSNELDGISETVDLLEGLLNQQGEDIAALSKQRERLVALVHRHALASEELEQEIANKISEVHVLNDRIDELERAYEELESKCGQDDLRQKLAALFPETEVRSDSDLVEVVKGVLNMKPGTVVQVDRSRELLLLGHLKNALKLVKTIAIPDADPDERTFLMTQCARMTQFIEEFCGSDVLPNVVSIFEDRDCEAQMETVMDFIETLPQDDAPAQELHALLTGTLYINRMLFSQVDRLEKLGDAQREQQLLAEMEKMQRIIDKNEEERDVILDKVAKHMHVASQDLVSVVDDLLYQYEEVNKELEEADIKNKELVDRMQKGENGSYQKDSASSQKLRKLVQKNSMLESEFENLQTTMENLTKERNDLMKSVEENESKHIREKQAIKRKYKSQLSEKNKEIENQVQMLSKENEKLQTLIEQMRQRETALEQEKALMAEEFYQKEKRAQAKILDFAQRMGEMETVNASTLLSIKDKNKKLQEQYEERLNALTAELEEARNVIDGLHNEISTSKLGKQELQRLIAKMKLNERTLQLQLKQVTDQTQAQESAIKTKLSAQITAIQTEFDEKLRHERDTVEHYTARIVSIIEKAFNVNIGSASPDKAIDVLESFIQKKFTLHWKQLTEDATAIRHNLKLKNGESLLDAFNNLQRNYTDTLERNAKLERHNRQLESENDTMKALEDKSDEVASWSKWATNLYARITDGAIPAFSPADIRYALEEALLAAIGHRTLLRRLEVLRAEKQLILDRRSLLLKPATNTSISLCPLVVIAMFVRRLENMTGCFCKSRIKSTASFSTFNM